MKFFIVAGMMLAAALTVQAKASPFDTDPPANAASPAALVEIPVPSHGVQLLGALYLAEGAGPHPTAIIFHGFPGYEQNLDIAQVLRRAGYNVLAAHYRGSWGVSGTFSFQHAIEDADAQVEWIRSPAVAAKYHVDPAHIVVIGHSMGGYMALSAAAHNPEVAAAISISGASLGHRYANLPASERAKSVARYVARTNPVDLLPLKGTSAEALGGEVFDHRNDWDFEKLAPALGKRPVLLFSADDNTGPNAQALLETLKAQGNTFSQHIEIKTNHPYSDHRVALTRDILDWLAHKES